MNNKKNLYIFLLLLPILDLITSLSTRYMVTAISIGVIAKTLLLVFMFIYLLKSTSIHKKTSMIYVGIILIYILGYFLTKINGLTISSFVKECNYMIKLCFYPILLSCLYCYFDEKHFSKKEIINILIIILLEFTVLLTLPILTKTANATYNYGLSGIIGWFYSANEISIILILVFPFIYEVIKKKRKIYLLIPIFIVMIISTIGTKSSMLGLIISTSMLTIISLFYKKSKKFILTSFIMLVVVLGIFSTSNSLTNFKVTLGIQHIQNIKINEERVAERKVLKEELNKLKKEEKEKKKKQDKQEENKIEEFLNTYGRALLSDRDLYVKVTYKLYQKHYSLDTLLFGIGYTNTDNINNRAIEKLIEIDPLDIFFHSGLIALVIILLPFIYFIVKAIKKSKITINIAYYTLMLSMIFCISCISGHTFMAPAVSIYLVIYFILAYNELDLINKKTNKIQKNKISIYALHLNYGGVEKNICTKANILSKKYDVEIISFYKLNDKPSFKLNKNIKVTYLTKNIKPNKEEIKQSIKSLNPFKIVKEGLYALKVLYLKNILIAKSMINCNSGIIISTRIEFSTKLIKLNEYKNIKIAEEHIYHNNNKKYFKKLKKVLNYVDYLMPSSNYLTNFYKEKYNEYGYKIITNEMPIETDYSVSKLKNKTIISVGRLSKEKGYDDLIKIFAKSNNEDWTLNIVGDGPEYNHLENLIKELNIENKVNLLGFKTSEELNKIYSEASIYIMTSYEESFGLVLLEAASHGLPIISYSSALGACEILKDNNGILISNRNEKEMITKLNELMEDLTLRKTYQKKSLIISSKYNYEDIEKNNINFFEKIKQNNIYTNLYGKSKEECYKFIEEKLKNKQKTFIITANPETYMLTTVDKEMNEIVYNKENLVVPDGIAIVKTAKYLRNEMTERIPGIDIAEHLLDLANKNKYKVYLFGASIDVIEKMEKVINETYPNIKLVGASNGYIKDKDSVMEYIKTTEPDIVMLALGIPLQEKLINKHINDFKKGIFIGVGGSFDVISGTKKRAPKIFIESNSEWLYRIICEPKRIKRFIKYNTKFITKILKERKIK